MPATDQQKLRYSAAIINALSRGPSTPCALRNFDLWTSTIAAERVTATKLCAGCSIRQACDQIAVTNRETSGVWGGRDRGP